MSNFAFYIFALVAIVIAAGLMKVVVTCLMRTIVLLVLAAVLTTVYCLFVYQHDPEVREAVKHAVEKVEKAEKADRHGH